EEDLPSMQQPKFVFYGFFSHHEDRNVASMEWLKSLAKASRTNTIGPPFVSLDSQGVLKRHPPENYPAFPLRQYSSLVELVESDYVKLKSRHRTDKKREATQRLVLEMRDISKKYGAEFIFVFLVAPDEVRNNYQRFLAESHIKAIDCSER